MRHLPAKERGRHPVPASPRIWASIRKRWHRYEACRLTDTTCPLITLTYDWWGWPLAIWKNQQHASAFSGPKPTEAIASNKPHRCIRIRITSLRTQSVFISHYACNAQHNNITGVECVGCKHLRQLITALQ